MPLLLKELREKILDLNIPVSLLLRQALIIAKQSDHEEFIKWIDYELNGYPVDVEPPSYRILNGQVMYESQNGYKPVSFRDGSKNLYRFSFRLYIKEFEIMIQKNEEVLVSYFPESLDEYRTEILGDLKGTEPGIGIDKSSVLILLEIVRNKLLDWVTDLEQKNLSKVNLPTNFHQDASVPSPIFIAGEISNSSILINSHSPNASQNSTIKEEVDKKPKESILNKCLKRMKKIIEDVAANVATQFLLKLWVYINIF